MAWSAVSEKKAEGKRPARNRVVEVHASGEAPPSDTASREKPENDPAAEKNKDLHGGMELLELDFLLSIIENTKGKDQNDVTMRKLNFNEVLRREKQNEIDSNALAVYVVNAGNLYGKDIQCEATKELTRRTAK
jgi:hypothetical protein